MRLGYNTNGFAHHQLVDAITILGELGYESVALTLDYHVLNPFEKSLPGQIEEVRSVLSKYGMHCVIETGARFLLDPWRKHQPTLLSESPQAEKRVDFLCRSIDIALALNADAVSFWSGASESDESDEVLWERLVAGCRQVCEYAENSKMRLAFEPEPGMLIDTMDRFARLHETIAHPLFGLTLDLGHLQCQGELPIADHIHHWRDRLWNIHIEDMCQGVHDHLRFGEGEMDFPPIFWALDAIDYQAGLHVELSRHSHQAVTVARESLGFLRSCIKKGKRNW